MSDEQRKDEEPEVEAHRRYAANEEPSNEGEGEAETDDEVEAHVRKSLPRKI
jgi:hypothetical protein